MNPIQEAKNEEIANQANNSGNDEKNIIIDIESQGEKNEIIENEEVEAKEKKGEGEKEENSKGEEPKEDKDKNEVDNSFQIKEKEHGKEIDIDSLSLEAIKNLLKEQQMKYAKLEKENKRIAEENNRIAKEKDRIAKENEIYRAELEAHNIPNPLSATKYDEDGNNKKKDNEK